MDRAQTFPAEMSAATEETRTTEKAAPLRGMRMLVSKVRFVRRLFVTAAVLRGLAFALLAFVGLLGAGMVFDWLIGLPWFARAAILLAALIFGAIPIYRRTIIPIRRVRKDDEVAKIIERVLPQFKTRFIASIQLGRDPKAASSNLVRILVTQTQAVAREMPFSKVVPFRTVWLAWKRTLYVFAGVALLGWLAGGVFPILVKRAFLLPEPLPGKTRIAEVTPGTGSATLGEDLKIVVRGEGILPSRGTVSITAPSGEIQRHTLERSPEDRAVYVLTLSQVMEGFDYSVQLNDANAGPFHLSVHARPVVTEVQFEERLPDYLNLPPKRRTAQTLDLLTGSRLQVSARATTDLRSAWVQLLPSEKKVPLTHVSGPNASGEIPITEEPLSGFTVHVENLYGGTSPEGVVYKVRVLTDEDPAAEIIYPVRRQEMATKKAKVLLGLEATDDYGVTELAISYGKPGASKEEIRRVELQLDGNATALRRRFEWDLATLRPPVAEGDVIEYWLEVKDAKPGAEAIHSERREIRVVTEAEKRADLANQLGDAFANLEQVTETQRDLRRRLGEVILAKPPSR
jgi:hypothetical protein